MIKIICIGKKHDALFAGAIEHYQERLSKWHKLEWLILPPSGSAEVAARDEESSRIISKITTHDFVILLDETGKNITSPELAQYIEIAQNSSKQIVLIIGGAYGVNAAVKDRANNTIAFGQSVFPHQLVRLMLVEQLYRACSINAGSQYHHE